MSTQEKEAMDGEIEMAPTIAGDMKKKAEEEEIIDADKKQQEVAPIITLFP